MGAKARINPHQNQPGDQLNELLSSVRYMGEEADLDRLLPFIAEHAVKALQADRCSIFLADPQQGDLFSRYLQGERTMIRIPLGSGIAGKCVQNSESFIINDAYSHPLFNRDVDKETGYVTRSILCVPMINIDRQVVGCFQVINKLGGYFSDADESLLAAFAAQAATALQSSLHAQERKRMVEQLSQTKQELALALKRSEAIYALEQFASRTRNMQGLLETALATVMEAVSCGYAALHLRSSITPDQNHWTFLQQAGNRKVESNRQPECEATERGPLNLKANLETTFSIKCGLQLVIPMELATNDPKNPLMEVGEILVCNPSSDGFSHEDSRFIELIGAQVATVFKRQVEWKQQSESERMATIGKLATTLVHDMRSPMSAISAVSQVASMKGSLNEADTTKYMAVIDREVERCNEMLEEVLDLAAGKTRLQINDVDIENFFKDIQQSLSTKAENFSIDFKIECSTTGTFSIDSRRLTRVILNMANNAFEAMNSGGQLTIGISDQGDRVRIEVKDTGPGIASNIRNTIFEPFVTAGKDHGVGLGMYITREIIMAHGGSISIDDSYTGGACFHIHLPHRQQNNLPAA